MRQFIFNILNVAIHLEKLHFKRKDFLISRIDLSIDLTFEFILLIFVYWSEETRRFNVIVDDPAGVTCLVLDRQSYREMIADELSKLKREESFRYMRTKYRIWPIYIYIYIYIYLFFFCLVYFMYQSYSLFSFVFLEQLILAV